MKTYYSIKDFYYSGRSNFYRIDTYTPSIVSEFRAQGNGCWGAALNRFPYDKPDAVRSLKLDILIHKVKKMPYGGGDDIIIEPPTHNLRNGCFLIKEELTEYLDQLKELSNYIDQEKEHELFNYSIYFEDENYFLLNVKLKGTRREVLFILFMIENTYKFPYCTALLDALRLKREFLPEEHIYNLLNIVTFANNFSSSDHLSSLSSYRRLISLSILGQRFSQGVTTSVMSINPGVIQRRPYNDNFSRGNGVHSYNWWLGDEEAIKGRLEGYVEFYKSELEKGYYKI